VCGLPKQPMKVTPCSDSTTHLTVDELVLELELVLLALSVWSCVSEATWNADSLSVEPPAGAFLQHLEAPQRLFKRKAARSVLRLPSRCCRIFGGSIAGSCPNCSVSAGPLGIRYQLCSRSSQTATDSLGAAAHAEQLYSSSLNERAALRAASCSLPPANSVAAPLGCTETTLSAETAHKERVLKEV
jgi:hypothetical protein